MGRRSLLSHRSCPLYDWNGPGTELNWNINLVAFAFSDIQIWYCSLKSITSDFCCCWYLVLVFSSPLYDWNGPGTGLNWNINLVAFAFSDIQICYCSLKSITSDFCCCRYLVLVFSQSPLWLNGPGTELNWNIHLVAFAFSDIQICYCSLKSITSDFEFFVSCIVFSPVTFLMTTLSCKQPARPFSTLY